MQSFPRYRVCLFSILPKAHIIDIEYPQGTCSPNFFVKDFSAFFTHPSVTLIKHSRSA